MKVRKTKFTCERGHTDMWLYPTGKIRCHSCQPDTWVVHFKDSSVPGCRDFVRNYARSIGLDGVYAYIVNAKKDIYTSNTALVLSGADAVRAADFLKHTFGVPTAEPRRVLVLDATHAKLI